MLSKVHVWILGAPILVYTHMCTEPLLGCPKLPRCVNMHFCVDVTLELPGPGQTRLGSSPSTRGPCRVLVPAWGTARLRWQRVCV